MLQREKILKHLVEHKTAKTTDLMNLLKMREPTFYNSIDYYVNSGFIKFDKDKHVISLAGYVPPDEVKKAEDKAVNKVINDAIVKILSKSIFFYDRLYLPSFWDGITTRATRYPLHLWKLIELYNSDKPVKFDRKERLLNLVSNEIGESKEKIREKFDKIYSSFLLYQKDDE